ncbi:MAG TPA: hypothetical protein VN759_01220 [Pseudolysinimonas sp.]|nr:hypothetical protein [Pseudolysinimonas sp.]
MRVPAPLVALFVTASTWAWLQWHAAPAAGLALVLIGIVVTMLIVRARRGGRPARAASRAPERSAPRSPHRMPVFRALPERSGGRGPRAPGAVGALRAAAGPVLVSL